MPKQSCFFSLSDVTSLPECTNGIAFEKKKGAENQETIEKKEKRKKERKQNKKRTQNKEKKKTCFSLV